MNRRQVLLAPLVVMAAPATIAESMVTEVIPAGFRSAEELARVLRPLVPSPGSVSGFSGQLIIKTTPENMAEIKRVLATLDKAPSNLLVTVRHTLDAEVQRDLAEAAVRIGSGSVQAGAGNITGSRGATVSAGSGRVSGAARINSTTQTRRGSDAQTVRVLEGREAFIRTGESVPVPDQSVVITGSGAVVSGGTRYEEFGSGFYVRPRLAGDRVTLDIIPSRRQLRGDGSARVQEASTSVSGVLGRWMEIGGVNTSSTRSSRGVISSRTRTTRRDDRIFVKVERLD